jgi:hypothetical protein
VNTVMNVLVPYNIRKLLSSRASRTWLQGVSLLVVVSNRFTVRGTGAVEVTG